MPFETFGFATNYTVELNPEQPGTGWGDSRRALVRPGVNEAVVARVTPDIGLPWLAVDGATSAPSPLLCATPNPDVLCFYPGSNEFGGVLIDVRNATVVAEFGENIRTAYGSREVGLVLLASWTEIIAVGVEGIVWESGRVALDDLTVVSVGPSGIVCEGLVDDFAVPSRFTLDPATGEHLDGPEFAHAFRRVGLVDLARWSFSALFRRKKQ
jgi:hypothetical protein